jgi:NDP-sugar pyrophosphorylase family protein
MKTLLLAAGEGQRLRPLTLEVPKPMIRVAGLPILEHNIRLLVKHGFDEIFINTHYKPESVTGYFGDGSAWGARIQYAHEPTLRGTAGALDQLRDYLNETFLLFFGDNLTNCNLTKLLALHRQRGGCATMALFARENTAASGIAELGPDDQILRFVEKPRPEESFSNLVNAGMIVCEPSVLSSIPAGVPFDFGRDLLPKLIANGEKLFGYRMVEELYWIDSLDDYERTTRELANGFISDRE